MNEKEGGVVGGVGEAKKGGTRLRKESDKVNGGETRGNLGQVEIGLENVFHTRK